MEFQQGSDGAGARASLRLVDAGGETIWEPDPAVDADELDALAELFIGDDGAMNGAPEHEHAMDDTDDAPDIGRRRDYALVEPSVEAVITGHLPVRGAVWVRAYAAAVSRAEGRPVALVRVTVDRTTVELIGSSVHTDPVRDVDLAIQAVSSATEHWLLHFDDVDQASLFRDPGVGRVTVLSGADEPAIVSAYRLLKTVSDDRGTSIADGDLDVGISIVGSPPDETARATDRLGIAARRFLSMELARRTAVPKVETATVSLIGALEARLEPASLLATIAECVGTHDSASADGLHAAIAGSRTEDSAGRAVRSVLERVAGGDAQPAQDTATAPTEAARAPSAVEADREVARGVGVADDDGPAPSRPLPSSLVAGLTGLDLPCPVAADVELATDGSGGLHLLAWWDDSATASLLKARVWAAVNMPLLARLSAVDATARRVTAHVVCESVNAAADLRGGDIRVHLAQPVTAATANGWVMSAVS